MRILAFAALILVGCTPIKHPQSHTEKPPAPVVTDLKSYYLAVQYAIQSEFYDADHYIGKTCNLRIDLDDKGQLSGLHVFSGDLSLCTAAMDAAKQAVLPAPPSAQVHEQMKHAVLVFAPQ
ncbi:cell envelope integrity TolA C-terminal domain-containing protein [Candidatus Pantoea formicae]|uniref:cell envelope integrity TolA C-terminal domain-containing protein n=1 Tax=Candidatus Pantoea formicae TaxID=2608355 RepID=UPI003ED88ABB